VCSVPEVVDRVLYLLEVLTVMSYILLCALYAEGPGGRTLGYVLEPLEMMYSVLELGEAMRHLIGTGCHALNAVGAGGCALCAGGSGESALFT